MIIREEQWQHIPVLHIVEQSKEQQPVPVVLFFHGFKSAKEHNLHYAYNLAKQGVRVILPDALLHGGRSESLTQEQLALRFWEIVLTNIQEADILYNELKEKKLITDTTPVGMGGTSMGGITTFGSLASYSWIDAASVMMGSPAFVRLAKGQMKAAEKHLGGKLPMKEEELAQLFAQLETLDLSKHPERLENRPLFIWHGEQDTLVPFGITKEFYENIAENYPAHKLRFMPDEEAGHAVTRGGMLASVNWLADHLLIRQDV